MSLLALRNASRKPELFLSFETVIGSGEQVLNVTADQAKMMIRVEEP